MPHERRPTLKSVADIAGVCAMTVSLALRNSPKITEATRQRIHEIANRVGYKPNPFATLLVSMRTAAGNHTFHGNLAILNCGSTETAWRRSPTFRRIMEGARQRAEALGYTLDELWFADPQVSNARLRQTLLSRGIQGILFAFFDGNPATMERLRAFDFSEFSPVTVSRKMEHPGIHSVSSDQYFAATQAMKKLIERGYTRIGLVVNDWVDAGLERRFRAGYIASLAALPAHRHIPVFETPETFPAALLSWIKTHKVEAIVTLPCSLHAWLKNAGISIPGDVGLACLDVLIPGHGLAGIDQKSELVGSAAVDEVVGQIHRNETGIPGFQKTLSIHGEWTEGESVRPLSQAVAAGAHGNAVAAPIPA